MQNVIDGVSGMKTDSIRPQELADAIVGFYTGAKEAALSAGAAEEKKKYSWDAIVEAIEQLSTE